MTGTATRRSTPHTTATRKLIRASKDWTTDDDAPAIAILLSLAAELDKKVTASLATSYAQTYRNLLSRKPTTSDEVDPLGALLDDAQST